MDGRNGRAPSLTLSSQEDHGEALVGILECVYGLGVALANAGLVTRAEIAAAMSSLLQQQEDAGALPPRMYPAKVLRHLFSAQVIGDPARRFTVVDGDKPGPGQEDLPNVRR
jgi:hypothetical protein